MCCDGRIYAPYNRIRTPYDHICTSYDRIHAAAIRDVARRRARSIEQTWSTGQAYKQQRAQKALERVASFDPCALAVNTRLMF
jgi:hypothetical protein